MVTDIKVFTVRFYLSLKFLFRIRIFFSNLSTNANFSKNAYLSYTSILPGHVEGYLQQLIFIFLHLSAIPCQMITLFSVYREPR